MRQRTFDSFSPSVVLVGLLSCACSGTGDATGGTSTGGTIAAGGSAQGGVSSGGLPSGTGGTTSTGGVSGSASSGGSGVGGSVASGGGSASGGVGTSTGGSSSGGSATAGTTGFTGGSTATGGNSPGGSSAGGSAPGGAGGKASSTGGAAGSAMGGAAGSTGTGGSAGSAGATSGDVGKAIGFATMNGGTTGGQGGERVTASTFAQLKTYAESATAYVISIAGTISNGANGGTINVKSNKSLVGVGSTAFLNGVGLNIANANNVIVQNLRVSLIGVTTRTDTAGVYSSTGDGGLPQILVNGGDAISISGTSKNVWIDHCELFSENPDTQTNKDLYDGLIDIKGQTGFITISWCYLHDHHKGGLVGASDTDLFADRKVTYHHNYYNKIKLRVPMYRGSVGHFFNNYVVGAQDATEIRADTCVRVEKNYYEALHYSIYTTSDSAGSTERIDNVEVSRTSRAYPTDCKADIPYPYSTALTGTTSDVKSVVPQSAGVGKI